MNDFSFLITDESGLSYTFRGYGPLADYYLKVQFHSFFTEDRAHAATVIESSFATFPAGSGIVVTRWHNEVFVRDSF